MQVGVKVR